MTDPVEPAQSVQTDSETQQLETEFVQQPTSPVRITCDNHPDREAVLVTTGNGRFSEVHLCWECATSALRAYEA